ncbi:MAG: galactokinase [Bryobacteraceae bacterium]
MASPAISLGEAFRTRFGAVPELFYAPGRVNLIGEHTDYNLGFVLPIAIDLACYTASAANRDGVFRIYSLNLDQGREWPVAELETLSPAGDWTDYVIGVVRQIPQNSGRDILIDSAVPSGSGLSSSAALEVSIALAAGWKLDAAPKIELAKLCQRAENDFVGLPSGIMDQCISVFGHASAAVKIDCRSLERETVPLPAGAALVAVNSMVKHELGQSAYRQRVAECGRAVEAIRKVDPEVASLRDVTIEQLDAIDDSVARRRARHVITENQRVLEFVEACRRRDLAEMGRLFVASHRSLQFDYEVSCEEIDFLVDTALTIPGVYGARITGGGFGGCTVSLMKPDAVQRFESTIAAAYSERWGREPKIYPVRAAAGAAKIS